MQLIHLKVAAAATADAAATIVLTFKAQIISATLSPDLAATANGTNYASFALESNNGAGGAFAAIATAQTTASVSHAVGTSIAFAGVTKVLASGSVVRLTKTHAGSGVAIAVTVSILVRKVV